jgi:hypothetical protein
MKSLPDEAFHALHLLAKRKNPEYKFSSEYQFISSIVFLARNTSPCLICGKELDISFRYDNEVIINHGLEHLKEYNLLSLI